VSLRRTLRPGALSTSTAAARVGDGGGAGVDSIADTGHSRDQPGFAQSLTQGRDCDSHRVGERIGVLIPCSLEKFLGTDDSTLRGSEHLQHRELFAGERNVAAIPIDLAPERVHAQTCDFPHGRPAPSAPAVQRPKTEHQFAQVERLREVVVGTELEPGGLVIEAVGRGEHQDRHPAACGHDVRGDFVAGGPRDVAIEDRNVVRVDAQQLKGGVAVASDIGRDRLEAKPVPDGLRHVGLILDNQHTHALDATSKRILWAYRKPHTGRQHRADLTGSMTQMAMKIGAMKSDKSSVLSIVLFAIYAALLIGVILFKFPFSSEATGNGRAVNLIPFAGSFRSDGVFRLDELIENVVIFVPLGVYLSMVKRDWSFARKLLLVVGVTVAFETIQYIFAIGRADITDVLTNTLGGLVGIGVYAVVARLLGKRTDRVINVVALILTVFVLSYSAFLWSRSR
jgi:glycopeptide antibiotics resistance protein